MKKFTIVGLMLFSAIIGCITTVSLQAWADKPAHVVSQPLPIYNYDDEGYKLECSPNGYAIYDGVRFVGVIKYGSCKPLDKIVDNDNQ